MKIPTRSPQRLLIKLAIAVEAETLGEIDDALAGWGSDTEELLQPLAADLQAMARRATA
jgi:hypothetical protein